MPKTHSQSLLHHPDPLVRKTYASHLWLFVLGAPFNAMIQYAPFLAIKTFHASAWAPALSAIIPAAHLLAVFFINAINRSNKVSWVVNPTIFSNLIFLLLIWVRHDLGWLFAMVIIFSLLLRAPIISAQSAIFRINYPPDLRSYALSVPMAAQNAINALFALGAGIAFDMDEKWVIPYFLLSAFVGVVGAMSFATVKCRETSPSTAPIEQETSISYFESLKRQFDVLFENPSFCRYQISYMFFGSGTVAIAAVLPFYLQKEFGASHQEATAVINTVPMLTIALTLPLWGWLLDRSNPLVMRAVTTGIWSVTPLLLLVAHTMHQVYAAQLIQGAVFSGSTLIWWLGVNYFARSHEVANLMALHQTLTGVRGVITPFVGIWLGNLVGYRDSMIFWFILMVIGFFIMLDEVRREMRRGKLRSFSETEAVLDVAPPQPASPNQH
ncbi:MFS transporter [Candidatus Sumerlaeota bacterium]|nr:MFS transporter [Candidatus Sumerlaeota bacterium]MBI3736859.1 MFS transporter [Candidatus Sumerlaeota bacterium]